MTGSLGNLVFCIGDALLSAPEEPRHVYDLLQTAAQAFAWPGGRSFPIGLALLAYNLFFRAVHVPDQTLASDVAYLAGQALREQGFLDTLTKLQGPEAMANLKSLLASSSPGSTH